MKEKELVELRNMKVEEMQKILDAAKADGKPLAGEDLDAFNALKDEVEGYDRLLEASDKMAGMKYKPVPNGEPSAEDSERKKFENFLRGIRNADEATMPGDAAAIIPTTIWDRIISKVIQICPVFELADRYNIGGKLVLPRYDEENSSIVMDYAVEGPTPPAESGKVVLTSIELNGYLGRCLAKVSVSLINNTNFDIVGFVEAKMAQAIALFIEKELLHGTADKIEGLSGIGDNMTVTSAADDTVTPDELIDLQELVIDNYQGNAIWVMNRATRTAIRKLKDKDGNFLLNRDLSARWGYTLLGRDVYCSDAMDTMGAGAVAIYYGDLTGLAVKVSENPNMQILREKYADEHMIGVLGFVELDAKVADTQKLARLVCPTTTH